MNEQELLQAILLEIKTMKQDLIDVKQDMSGMKQGLTDVKQNMSSMKQGLTDVKQDLSSMKQDIRDNRILIENNVMRDIHLIAEQHTDIIEKLDAIADYGDTKGRVSTLENVAKSHTDDIKELQKKIG